MLFDMAIDAERDILSKAKSVAPCCGLPSCVFNKLQHFWAR